MSAIATVFETGRDGQNAPWGRYNARGLCEFDGFVLVVALCDKYMAQLAARIGSLVQPPYHPEWDIAPTDV